MNSEIPDHLKQLDENLSLSELIKVINADRARKHAENESGYSLTWDSLATSIRRSLNFTSVDPETSQQLTTDSQV
jgi:hypothetical protein